MLVSKENVLSVFDLPGANFYLNNGNALFCRETYLEVATPFVREAPLAADELFFKCYWFEAGGKVRTIDGMEYFHRIHDGSNWMTQNRKSVGALALTTRALEGKLLELGRKYSKAKPVGDLSVMVVSKDRPFFLEQLLLSIKDERFSVTVLYLATSEEYAGGYKGVVKKFPKVKWIRQNKRGSMRQTFRDWLVSASDIVMVCPDDNVCMGPVDVPAIRAEMEAGDCFGFSLRLSPRVYRSQSNSISKIWPDGSGTVISFEPSKYERPWSYVWEMSSTFYRQADVSAVVEAGDFSTINELEERGLRMFPSEKVGRMACFQWAPMTNVFVNTNFQGSQWCVSERVTDADAVNLFREGRKIDLKRTFEERDRMGVTHVKGLFLMPKEKLSNSAIVVIPAWNTEKWIEKSIRSVLEQTYQDVGIIFIDDSSSDQTFDIGSRVLDGVRDVIVKKNTSRNFVLANMYSAVRDCCSNPDSVIFTVDGDDWLTTPTAIAEMMDLHKEADVVWSQYEKSDGARCPNGELPSDNIRKERWLTSHLRSYKKFLFDAIKDEDFFDTDGEMYRMACDQAQMLPVLEMVPKSRRKFYPKVLYHYNRENSFNNDKVNHSFQQGCASRIRKKKPYQVLERYLEQVAPVKTPPPPLKIKVVILNHNTPKTVLGLYNKLSPVFDVTVFDSGSDPDKKPDCPYEDFGNLYWTGCWNKALELYGDSDVLWVLGGDVTLMSEPEKYWKCIEELWPFGIWSPAVVGRCRGLMGKNNVGDEVVDLWQLEGIAFAVNVKILKGLGGFPKEMRIGWGCDIWLSWKCKAMNAPILLDGRVIFHHPSLQGYETQPAIQELMTFFQKNVAYPWWKAVHHESDTFAYHLVGKHDLGPRVSVVIPCYRQAQYLARSVRSVFHQKTGNVEVVIVNDGSPDNCDEVVRSIQSEFSGKLIQYVKQENKGLPGARNAGFEAARSKLVFTLDADDCLHPETLERCLREEALGADVAYVDLRKRSGKFEEMNLSIKTMDSVNSVAACALIRKSVWTEVGGYKDEMREGCEDWEFWINCLENGFKFSKAKGAEVLVDDVHDGRMSPHIQRRDVYLRIRETVRRLHPDFCPDKFLKKAESDSRSVRVGVVISYFKQAKTLPLLLESLFFQSEVPSIVVVADDGSEDGVVDWVHENATRYPFQLICVTRKNEGYRLASLNNLGARAVMSECDRLLFTNADVVHSPFSIKAHASIAGVGGGMVDGILAGMVSSVDLEMVRNFQQLLSLSSRHKSSRSNRKYVETTDPNKNPIGVWGGNFSVPVSTFSKLGGFDEEFVGWGGEDNDLTKRCVRAGCVAKWLPESQVIHLDHEVQKYAYAQLGSKRYAGK
jgi:glycosyltransferase involved in cell wall biosynthesis